MPLCSVPGLPNCRVIRLDGCVKDQTIATAALEKTLSVQVVEYQLNWDVSKDTSSLLLQFEMSALFLLQNKVKSIDT